MRRIFGNGRYANVTATLALVVALSGTAYAAATITSAQIVNGTIQGIDIKANTVTSSDIKDGTVTGGDIKFATIGPDDIANNGVDSLNIADGTIQAVDLAPGTVAPQLFASFLGDGTLISSSGVVAVTRYGAGNYGVEFDRDVSACGHLATANGRNGAHPSGDRNTGTASGAVGFDNHVFVRHEVTSVLTDIPITLMVIC